MAGTHVDGVDDGVGYGVKGENTTPVVIGNHEPGTIGTSQSGVGVFGTSGDISSFGVFGNAGTGVQGVCVDGTGVSGLSSTGQGVTGSSKSGSGVFGLSESGLAGKFNGNVQVNGNASIEGVLNVTSTATTAFAVKGNALIEGTVTCQTTNPGQPGVLGQVVIPPLPGITAIGVKGDGGSGGPPIGGPGTPVGKGVGVVGTTSDPNGTGVWGINTAGGNSGAFNGNVAVSGRISASDISVSGSIAVPSITVSDGITVTNLFVGQSLNVGQNLNVLGTVFAKVDVVLGSDCAVDFDIGLRTNVEPGTVMALDEHGLLQESQQAYDKKVAGVISGAGEFKPGLILGRDKGQADCRRAPVALLGKVYCKVDAQDARIDIGDLLTTSPTPGHAMKAEDPIRAFGAVIGKALRSMSAGQKGLIPILVALQ